MSGQHALAVPKVTSGHGSETEGVDDILDAVVRTATKKSSDQQPRDRLRARNVDRKSCKFYCSSSPVFLSFKTVLILSDIIMVHTLQTHCCIMHSHLCSIYVYLLGTNDYARLLTIKKQTNTAYALLICYLSMLSYTYTGDHHRECTTCSV